MEPGYTHKKTGGLKNLQSRSSDPPETQASHFVNLPIIDWEWAFI